MKTAEEYRKGKLPWQHRDAVDNTNQYLYTDNEIKQIQLDAMKEGYRRAAEIQPSADGLWRNDELDAYRYCRSRTEEAILTEAYNLTEKDI